MAASQPAAGVAGPRRRPVLSRLVRLAPAPARRRPAAATHRHRATERGSTRSPSATSATATGCTSRVTDRTGGRTCGTVGVVLRGQRRVGHVEVHEDRHRRRLRPRQAGAYGPGDGTGDGTADHRRDGARRCDPVSTTWWSPSTRRGERSRDCRRAPISGSSSRSWGKRFTRRRRP